MSHTIPNLYSTEYYAVTFSDGKVYDPRLDYGRLAPGYFEPTGRKPEPHNKNPLPYAVDYRAEGPAMTGYSY
ncbi:unnamed protein product [Parascedosporium putredinis]|uniref:Uncharacterized protein n=1 Tax=Parascedosporium putredinis TaxID=1442378 RepID=A0A9P1MAA3_9PEZI|nr:unnamed protein product [Parascedosporium putredinis]CAI7993668.1 unnamed protein product [Parascedosporium putredinis]